MQMAKSAPIDNLVNEYASLDSEEEISSRKTGADNINIEPIRLRDICFNYKNKRVITQVVRFIPDDIADEALQKDDPEKFILDNVEKILPNSVIREFQDPSKANKDIINYPNHSDLYNINTEGVFIGKGFCFHNVTSNKNSTFIETLDKFVENVLIAGKSVSTSKDLIEKPRLKKVGGQKHMLIFGHQRYCYLYYAFGSEYTYYFNVSNEEENEDLTILLENNTKTEEHGYEKLQSYYYAYQKIKEDSLDKILATLSVKKSYFYKIKPFLDNAELIDVIKKVSLKASITLILDVYKDVKIALDTISNSDPKLLVESFESKLKKATHTNDTQNSETKTEKEKKPKLSKINIAASPNTIEKILFGDVRKYIDIENYDLNSTKDTKRLIRELIQSIESKRNE